MLSENPAEIERVFISHKAADFLNGIIGILQQLLGFIYTDGSNILHGRYAHITLETADKPAYAHMLVFCVFFYTDILCKGFVEIVDGRFQLPVAERVFRGFLHRKVKLGSLNSGKKLAQIKA